MRLRQIITILAACGLSLIPAEALACSCFTQSGSLDEQIVAGLESVDVVVTAVAQSTEMLHLDGRSEKSGPPERRKSLQYPEQRVIWQSIEVLRGNPGEQFFTQATTLGGMCGMIFSEGDEYLLYLRSPLEGGSYRTDTCTRTRRLDAVDREEIEILRSLREDGSLDRNAASKMSPAACTSPRTHATRAAASRLSKATAREDRAADP